MTTDVTRHGIILIDVLIIINRIIVMLAVVKTNLDGQ
jgi:hypothetical protein